MRSASMPDILAKQLALDYCCAPEDVKDAANHFRVFSALDGRRRFDGDRACKIAVINGKMLCAGRTDIIAELAERLRRLDGAWAFENDALRRLDEILARFGCRVGQVHLFFTAAQPTPVPEAEFDAVWYERGQIAQFETDERFCEAIAFCPDAPDVLGVAAVRSGEILGMAGASADSPYLWQIGVNTLPQARGRGIAPALAAMLKNEILVRGKLPYYGTALSHIASQRVAVKAGFLPAWAELLSEEIV